MSGLIKIICGTRSLGNSISKTLPTCLLAISICTYSKAQQLSVDDLNEELMHFPDCQDNVYFDDLLKTEFHSQDIQGVLSADDETDLKMIAVCQKQYKYGILLFIDTRFPEEENYDLVALFVDREGNCQTTFIGNNGYNLDQTSNSARVSLINDTIIQLIQVKYDFDFTNELEKNYEYFRICEHGIVKISSDQYSKKRQFPEGSSRILENEYLSSLSRHDLDIMRNEIFADHGYTFKSEKWKEYFYNQDWYCPRYDNVDHKLTDIEKINVMSILDVYESMK